MTLIDATCIVSLQRTLTHTLCQRITQHTTNLNTHTLCILITESNTKQHDYFNAIYFRPISRSSVNTN